MLSNGRRPAYEYTRRVRRQYARTRSDAVRGRVEAVGEAETVTQACRLVVCRDGTNARGIDDMSIQDAPKRALQGIRDHLFWSEYFAVLSGAPLPVSYSDRSATIGLTLVARRAGR